MKLTYRRVAGREATATTVAAVAPLFGQACRFTFTVYCVDGWAAITFGLDAADAGESGCGPLESLPGGVVRLTVGPNRCVEQRLVVNPVFGVALDWTELRDSGAAGARTVAAALLPVVESAVETVRQGFRRHLAETLRGRVTKLLEQRFQIGTARAVVSLLKELNWPLLLQAAECGAEALQALDTIFDRNPPRLDSIAFDGVPRIATFSARQLEAVPQEIADQRALRLLRKVCGEALTDQFLETGGLTVHALGCEFTLAPRRFILCRDPRGRQAKLCVHTVGLSCNPLDEVVIAYLWLRHQPAAYLRTANVFPVDAAFALPAEV